MRRAGWVAAALLLAGLVGSAPMTLARFTDAAAPDASLATGALQPPENLAATGGTTAALTWTPSTSTDATGYRVLRSGVSGAGYGVVAEVTPVTSSDTTDSPGSGTWYYVLRTWLGSWTSAASNEASVTVTGGSTGTGAQPCAGSSNAADTGGDDNGYEASPASGCVADGVVASDANSGTNLADSCTDPGKDRHRFWGWAFGLPAGVTSIDGIAIELTAGMSNSGGTTRVCAELSWDGGATWTAPQSVPLTENAVTTYALGGPADTWGRPWAIAELDPAALLVRLTNVTTQPNKTFRLDGVAIEVSYTP